MCNFSLLTLLTFCAIAFTTSICFVFFACNYKEGKSIIARLAFFSLDSRFTPSPFLAHFFELVPEHGAQKIPVTFQCPSTLPLLAGCCSLRGALALLCLPPPKKKSIPPATPVTPTFLGHTSKTLQVVLGFSAMKGSDTTTLMFTVLVCSPAHPPTCSTTELHLRDAPVEQTHTFFFSLSLSVSVSVFSSSSLSVYTLSLIPPSFPQTIFT